MIFQAEHHAALLGPRQEFFERVDHPFERLVVGVTGQRRLDSLLGHELVERLDRTPTAGVDPHGRDAEPVGQVDLVQSFLNVIMPLLPIGCHETLMGRKAHQGQPKRMSLAFELLKGGVRLVLHLNVEDLHAIEAQGGGLIDALRDRDPPGSLAELAEGIGRDADRVSPTRAVAGGRRFIRQWPRPHRRAASDPDRRTQADLLRKRRRSEPGCTLVSP